MSRTYVMILGVYTILCVIVIGLSVGTQYRVYQSHSVMKKMLAETSQRAEAMAAQRDREADIASLSMLLLFDLAHATNISLYQAKRETLLRIEEIVQRREKCYYDDTCYDWIKVALTNDSPEYLRETASMIGSEVKSRKSVSKKEYADEIDRLMGHLAAVEPSRESREKQWRDAVTELCLTASKLARHMQPRCMLLDVEPVKEGKRYDHTTHHSDHDTSCSVPKDPVPFVPAQVSVVTNLRSTMKEEPWKTAATHGEKTKRPRKSKGAHAVNRSSDRVTVERHRGVCIIRSDLEGEDDESPPVS